STLSPGSSWVCRRCTTCSSKSRCFPIPPLPCATGVGPVSRQWVNVYWKEVAPSGNPAPKLPGRNAKPIELTQLKFGRHGKKISINRENIIALVVQEMSHTGNEFHQAIRYPGRRGGDIVRIHDGIHCAVDD